MKHKIFSFVAACGFTATLMLATPMSPPAHADTNKMESYKTLIQACSVAFKLYRMGDNGSYLRKMLQDAPEQARPVLELTCAAYGKGYYDALKDVNLRIALNEERNERHV